MFEHLKDRKRNYWFLNRMVPGTFSLAVFPLLRYINDNYWNPFSGQALDFRMSGFIAGIMMQLAGEENKKREFIAAMSPAVIGSLDEITDFFHNAYGMNSNIRDGKDVIAYFLGALMTYGAIKIIRKGLNYLGVRKNSPDLSLKVNQAREVQQRY